MVNTTYTEIDRENNKTVFENNQQKSHYKSTSIDS